MIKKILIILFLIFFNSLSVVAMDAKILEIGDNNAKITVKVFSSLTCPHCATFHEKIFNKLKTEYIDNNKVRFEHHGFPLDLAALNAEMILRCKNDPKRNFELLSEIYKRQEIWAVGSDIKLINSSIKKIGREFGMEEKKMNTCLKNEEVQEQILNERIEAQKKYKISSTPTIFINEKKYVGKHDFNEFKKELEKIL
jgi:protein-disulfide isomerase|tara:strand:- start:3598 stop:4188 length:591 start_codon:yes stop_codon:yes gene_type:complete